MSYHIQVLFRNIFSRNYKTRYKSLPIGFRPESEFSHSDAKKMNKAKKDLSQRSGVTSSIAVLTILLFVIYVTMVDIAIEAPAVPPAVPPPNHFCTPLPNACTSSPTIFPTITPTSTPPLREEPSVAPTKNSTPSASPTPSPTKLPSASPTPSPTKLPSASPTPSPTPSPTKLPSASPTPSPTPSPTKSPSASPTPSPTPSPTKSPSASPTPSPTPSPTKSPSASPTPSPTKLPSSSPTRSPEMQYYTLSDTGAQATYPTDDRGGVINPGRGKCPSGTSRITTVSGCREAAEWSGWHRRRRDWTSLSEPATYCKTPTSCPTFAVTTSAQPHGCSWWHYSDTIQLNQEEDDNTGHTSSSSYSLVCSGSLSPTSTPTQTPTVQPTAFPTAQPTNSLAPTGSPIVTPVYWKFKNDHSRRRTSTTPTCIELASVVKGDNKCIQSVGYPSSYLPYCEEVWETNKAGILQMGNAKLDFGFEPSYDYLAFCDPTTQLIPPNYLDAGGRTTVFTGDLITKGTGCSVKHETIMPWDKQGGRSPSNVQVGTQFIMTSDVNGFFEGFKICF
jgi:hypothetical protein